MLYNSIQPRDAAGGKEIAMNCMNCGKPTIGNAVLCRDCANAERQRLQGGQPRRPRRAVIVLTAALALVSALAIGLTIYLAASANSRAVATAKLRVQQEELDRRSWELQQNESENAGLNDQIAALQADNESLRQQINTLDSQLGAADSERNQNTSNYIQQVADLEQQLRQLESSQKTMEEDLKTLQEDNKTLLSDKDELTKQLDSLQVERDRLAADLDDLQDRYDLLADSYRTGSNSSSNNSAQYLAYKKKADFLDSFIVFVQDDSTGYYHTYDCPNFTSSTFWAYNRALAKSQGYTACPKCGGGG